MFLSLEEDIVSNLEHDGSEMSVSSSPTGIQINILIRNILINILILPISITILVFVKELYQYCNIRAIYSSNIKNALFSNNSRIFWPYIIYYILLIFSNIWPKM